MSTFNLNQNITRFTKSILMHILHITFNMSYKDDLQTMFIIINCNQKSGMYLFSVNNMRGGYIMDWCFFQIILK